MSPREIITLQVGHYASFVGTHWWNLQESSFIYDWKTAAEFPKEVNHDILFREGKTTKGNVTYTPRLIIFDLEHSLGFMRKEGTLYDVPCEENIKWLGDVTLHQTVASTKNKFLQDLDDEELVDDNDLDDDRVSSKNSIEDDNANDTALSKAEDQVFRQGIYNLDEDVKVWSDFSRTRFHPRSVFLSGDHQHDNPEQPFNIFGVGQQIAKNQEQWDEMEDRIRYFSEECDYLQGFHVVLENHNAFGGLASSLLSYLDDEYSSKSRLSFAVSPAHVPDQTADERAARIINSALCLQYCSDHSSLYVPLSLATSLWRNVGAPVDLPHLQYNASLHYHTSSILAAAVDTATLPYRKATDCARMADIACTFNSMGRKVSALNVCLPFPMDIGSSFAGTLMSEGQKAPWHSLTPHVTCLSSPVFNSCVVRGIPSNMVRSEMRPESSARLLATGSSVEDVLKLYLTETYPSSLNAGCVFRDGIKVGAPFPHIFSSNVNCQGLLCDTMRSGKGVETVPVMTSLQSSNNVHSYIDSLLGCVSKFNITKHQHFIEAGLEPDEFTEVLSSLNSLASCYRECTGN